MQPTQPVPHTMIKTAQEEHDKTQEKELKRLLDAYTAVAKHKLGRAPSLEDLQKMLGTETGAIGGGEAPGVTIIGNPGTNPGTLAKDNLPGQETQQQAQPQKQPDSHNPSDPRILNLKVYYGMAKSRDGQRQHDESQVLYYEDPIDCIFYDCNNKEWTDQRPSILDHLQERPIKYDEKDLVSAIVHGVMDDESYEALDQKGMIGDLHKRLWDLTKTLDNHYNAYQGLTKSDDYQGEELSPDDILYNDDSYDDGVTSPGGGGSFGKLNAGGGGGASGAYDQPFEPDMPGDDVLKEIMQQAMAEAMIQNEDRIREIVREELGKSGPKV